MVRPDRDLEGEVPPALDNPYAGSQGEFGPLEGAQRAQQAGGGLPSPFFLAGGPSKNSELDMIQAFQPITAAERSKCEGAFHAKVGTAQHPEAQSTTTFIFWLEGGLLGPAVYKACSLPICAMWASRREHAAHCRREALPRELRCQHDERLRGVNLVAVSCGQELMRIGHTATSIQL